MRDFRTFFALTLAGLLCYTSAVAEAQEVQPADQPNSQSAVCFPACRTGYVCHQGKCISLCNPPCRPAEFCTAAGQCIVLAAPPPPAAAPPSPDYNTGSLGWFRWAYGHIGAILSPYGEGSLDDDFKNADYDLTSKFGGGIHLSGYWVTGTKCHLGAYLNYLKNKVKIEHGDISEVDNFQHLGVGISIKIGGKVSDRVWLGFAGDFGYYGLFLEDTDIKYRGIEISPRFHIDVLPESAGVFKMGFFAAIGPSIVPYINYNYERDNARIWLVTVQLRLGLTFGA